MFIIWHLNHVHILFTSPDPILMYIQWLFVIIFQIYVFHVQFFMLLAHISNHFKAPKIDILSMNCIFTLVYSSLCIHFAYWCRCRPLKALWLIIKYTSERWLHILCVFNPNDYSQNIHEQTPGIVFIYPIFFFLLFFYHEKKMIYATSGEEKKKKENSIISNTCHDQAYYYTCMPVLFVLVYPCMWCLKIYHTRIFILFYYIYDHWIDDVDKYTPPICIQFQYEK